MMIPQGGIVAGGTYDFKLTASKDGVVWDLTAATVTLILRKKGRSAALLSASVTSAVNGVAEYTTLTTDLSSGGTWYCSWLVVQGSVSVESPEEAFPVQASLAAA